MHVLFDVFCDAQYVIMSGMDVKDGFDDSNGSVDYLNTTTTKDCLQIVRVRTPIRLKEIRVNTLSRKNNEFHIYFSIVPISCSKKRNWASFDIDPRASAEEER